MSNLHVRIVSLTAAGTLAALLCTGVFGQAPVGDARRGQVLYADTYNCYACHGFDGQSGERRLVPLNYTQEGFTTFVQSSPLPNMPAFPDASPQVLADIFAYIKTLPADSPPLDDVALLKDILERRTRSAAN